MLREGYREGDCKGRNKVERNGGRWRGNERGVEGLREGEMGREGTRWRGKEGDGEGMKEA